MGIHSRVMSSRSRALSWLGFGGALLLIVSPLKLLWARAGFGWMAPFAIWFGLIALSAWLSRHRDRDDLR